MIKKIIIKQKTGIIEEVKDNVVEVVAKVEAKVVKVIKVEAKESFIVWVIKKFIIYSLSVIMGYLFGYYIIGAIIG